ncbi:hypothetical protein QJS66_04740 [Kocuria rhizophila]|nr:hypothetical protein QJS66_04740 [Kocuria rhizophila]
MSGNRSAGCPRHRSPRTTISPTAHGHRTTTAGTWQARPGSHATGAAGHGGCGRRPRERPVRVVARTRPSLPPPSPTVRHSHGRGRFEIPAGSGMKVSQDGLQARAGHPQEGPPRVTPPVPPPALHGQPGQEAVRVPVPQLGVRHGHR